MFISKFDNDGVERRIRIIEKKYRIAFPDLYRKFIIQYNGGVTPKTKFKVGDISSDIRGFFGFGNVKMKLDEPEIKDWMKSGFLPIACDSFGNYIVIEMSQKGRIYFYDHESVENLILLSGDLREFVNCCYSEKVSLQDIPSIKEREQRLRENGRGSVITDELRALWQREIDLWKSIRLEELIL